MSMKASHTVVSKTNSAMSVPKGKPHAKIMGKNC